MLERLVIKPIWRWGNVWSYVDYLAGGLDQARGLNCINYHVTLEFPCFEMIFLMYDAIWMGWPRAMQKS